MTTRGIERAERRETKQKKARHGMKVSGASVKLLANVRPSPKKCPLKDEWRAWPADKRQDRLFMNCPACGAYGSHVQEVKRGAQ